MTRYTDIQVVLKNKFTLSDLVEHLEKLGYSNQEIDEFIDLMVLEVKDFKRWNKLDEESKKYYNDITKEL